LERAALLRIERPRVDAQHGGAAVPTLPHGLGIGAPMPRQSRHQAGPEAVHAEAVIEAGAIYAATHAKVDAALREALARAALAPHRAEKCAFRLTRGTL
jgi:hypothetical protein